MSYRSTNTYATLNEPGPETQTTWIVFHGIGYLGRYFLKYFRELSPNENYIIAPQAPSKYYLNSQYKHVGASWLTKERTMEDLENVLAYIDAVLADQTIPKTCRINIMGYSQGASVALRWLCHSKHRCDRLILYAGGIPNEITPEDVQFFLEDTEVSIVFGKRDEFLTVERLAREEEKIRNLFGDRVQRVYFEGGHEVQPEVIAQFA